MMKNKLLMQAGNIGSMWVKNRIVMAPMAMQYASNSGHVNERVINYYKARAKGGVGLVIVETACVHQSGRLFINQLCISNDDYVPGLKELVRVIHEHNAKAAIQLQHAGAKARAVAKQLAPSSVLGTLAYGSRETEMLTSEAPEEVSIELIEEIIRSFANAARRAREAGFDGVEVHGAHGYLIDEFISPDTNRRNDKYGGSIENRARFLIETIQAIIKEVGTDFPVWCRINGRQYGIGGGTTLEEAKQIARMAQNAGACAIHVSAFGPKSPINLTSASFKPAVIEDLIEGIKQVVKVPVIGAGRITPEVGERLIQQGKADFVAIGKGLLADAEIPNKVAADRLEDINPCIICMRCRNDLFIGRDGGVGCTVNPILGREEEWKITPSKEPRKILVVGGGPAGMETSIVAAMRGHEVVLCEKESELGGQLIEAAVPPHKDRIRALTGYLKTQVQKLGIKVKLGVEVTVESIRQLKPDAVVLAAGVAPITLDIPGLDQVHVTYARDLLSGKAETGERVVVIGGELVGCETAEFLADRGKKVTVTRRGLKMALNVPGMVRPHLLGRLKEKGVVLIPGVRYKAVSPEGLVVITSDGKEKTIEADTIVVAAGSYPCRNLSDELKGSLSLYLVGDCDKPGTLRDAIAAGFHIGCQL